MPTSTNAHCDAVKGHYHSDNALFIFKVVISHYKRNAQLREAVEV